MGGSLQWWLVMARLAGEGMPIPSGYDECPPWAVMGDSDAAGGTRFEIGHGMGSVHTGSHVSTYTFEH